MLDCLIKKYLGVECPGCGMQRAFYSFITFDWPSAWEYNPAIFPLMILLGLILFSLINKNIGMFHKIKTTLWIKRSFYFFCFVLALQYTLKYLQ